MHPCSTYRHRASLGPGVQPRLRPSEGGLGLDAGRAARTLCASMGMKWANGDNDNRKRLPVKQRGKSSPIELLNIGARSKGNYGDVGSYGGFDDSKDSRDSLPPLALKQSSRN